MFTMGPHLKYHKGETETGTAPISPCALYFPFTQSSNPPLP